MATRAGLDLEPDSAARKNLALLSTLRWVAVAGQIVTIATVQLGYGIKLPLGPMAAVNLLLAGLNILTSRRLKAYRPVGGATLLAAMVADMAALTAQLWLSGGILNPFVSLYLLQVVLGAIILDAPTASVLVALACAGATFLTVAYRPLELPPQLVGHMLELHITGTLIGFWLDAILLAIFVLRTSFNLRERDERLATLRQQAAEEAQIVRMGLLASGAAHELGTPLSSIAVILGDWQRASQIRADPTLREELAEMQGAIRRCKAIVTGVLLSAGAARGEASHPIRLDSFLQDIAAEWRARRGVDVLHFAPAFSGATVIVSDLTLKQAVTNLLDNALDASPTHVELAASAGDAKLVLTVRDQGPGFRPDLLASLGTPYQSTKPHPGAGLGLFLVVNVVRKLGGTVIARNLPRGAEVCLELPLAVLALEADGDG